MSKPMPNKLRKLLEIKINESLNDDSHLLPVEDGAEWMWEQLAPLVEEMGKTAGLATKASIDGHASIIMKICSRAQMALKKVGIE